MSIELGNIQGPLEEWAKKAEAKYPAWAIRIREIGIKISEEAKLFEEAGGPKSFNNPKDKSAAQQTVKPPVQEPPENLVILPIRSEVLIPSQLEEKLEAELKTKSGKDIKLPPPRPEYLEIYRIFMAEGFNWEPIVYIEGKRAAYALFDQSVRPNYNEGKQLFKDDGLVSILKKGRRSGRILMNEWTLTVPPESRFGVSWKEIHSFVVPEVIQLSHHLSRLVEVSGTELRVPTKSHFQFAGNLRYAHLGEANTWEWLYDRATLSTNRLLGGRSDHGGLETVMDDSPLSHNDHFAFRLEVLTPSQKLVENK